MTHSISYHMPSHIFDETLRWEDLPINLPGMYAQIESPISLDPETSTLTRLGDCKPGLSIEDRQYEVIEPNSVEGKILFCSFADSSYAYDYKDGSGLVNLSEDGQLEYAVENSRLNLLLQTITAEIERRRSLGFPFGESTSFGVCMPHSVRSELSINTFVISHNVCKIGIDIAVHFPVSKKYSCNVWNLLMRYMISGALPSQKHLQGFDLWSISKGGLDEIDLLPAYFIDCDTLRFHLPMDLRRNLSTIFIERVMFIERAIDFLQKHYDQFTHAASVVENMLSLSRVNFKQGRRKAALRDIIRDCESEIHDLRHGLYYLYHGYRGPKKARVNNVDCSG